MPAQRAVSAMFKKYGAKLDTAVKTHVDDPIDYGNQRLPGGITNGVARLKVCTFEQLPADDKYYPNEFKFKCTGITVDPVTFTDKKGNEVKTEGIPTYISCMVCDTKDDKGNIKKTQDENIAIILNEMKKIGGEGFGAGAGGADLEQLAASLQEAQPYFYFSTRTSPEVKNADGSIKYEERVWETWLGSKGLENYTPPEDTSTEDNSPPATAPAAKPAPAAAKPPAKPPAKPAAKAAPEPEPEPEPEEFNEIQNDSLIPSDDDLDQLAVTAADADDEVAQPARDQLAEYGKAVGYTEKQIEEDFPDWEALVTAIKENRGNAGDGGEAPAEEPEAPPEPTKGDVYKYQPIDPKTKKPMVNPKTKKPVLVDCEIESVDKKNGTVNLLNLDDKKTKYAKVKMDALIGAD